LRKKTGTTDQLNVSDDVKKQLENNYTMFNALGLRGTPALIYGEQVIPGYLPYQQLEERLKEEL
jgi:protein-disulfide isomerase